MKAYLAKSNRANPTTVAEVRHALGQYKCEIVEYTGGQYTNGPLLLSDILILVLEDLKTGIIGKGLAQQIADFAPTKKPILVARGTALEQVYVSKLGTTQLIDNTDYIVHSKVILNEDVLHISDFIKTKQDIIMLS